MIPTYQVRILLVSSVFSRQQLNSETSRLRRRSFSFPKEWAYRFRNVSKVLKLSCHKENTSERESFQSLRSLPAQEAEGLEGLLKLPFLEDSTKRKPTKNRRQPAEKRRYQTNTSQILCFQGKKQAN